MPQEFIWEASPGHSKRSRKVIKTRQAANQECVLRQVITLGDWTATLLGNPGEWWETCARSYPFWRVREHGVGVLILWHFWPFNPYTEQAPVTRALPGRKAAGQKSAERQASTQRNRTQLMDMHRVPGAVTSVNWRESEGGCKGFNILASCIFFLLP